FSSRLMRVFRPIVQSALLLMLHRTHDFGLGCCVAAQLIGDDGTWDVLKAFQQLAKNFLAAFLFRRGCTRISSTSPSWSTARQRYRSSPLIVRKTSSRCHLSPRRPRLERIRLAYVPPNF